VQWREAGIFKPDVSWACADQVPVRVAADLYLILKKQFRTLTGFSLVAALLTGVSLWVVGWHGMATIHNIYGT